MYCDLLVVALSSLAILTLVYWYLAISSSSDRLCLSLSTVVQLTDLVIRKPSIFLRNLLRFLLPSTFLMIFEALLMLA